MSQKTRQLTALQMVYIFDCLVDNVIRERNNKCTSISRRFFIERNVCEESDSITPPISIPSYQSCAISFLSSIPSPTNSEIISELRTTTQQSFDHVSYSVNIRINVIGIDAAEQKVYEKHLFKTLVTVDEMISKFETRKRLINYINTKLSHKLNTDLSNHVVLPFTKHDVGNLNMNLSMPKGKELKKYKLHIDLSQEKHVYI